MNSKLLRAMVLGLIQLMLAACGGGSSSTPTQPMPNLPDTTPPTVVIVTPANGATNAAINTTASVNFSESIDCATATTTNIAVTTSGTPVLGTISCMGSSATFTPTGSLALSTTYAFSIGKGVKDLAGNALSSVFTSSFSTAVTPPTSTYTVSGSVSGLAAGAGVTLQSNGGESIALTASGAFNFTSRLASGAAYNVVVSTQPLGQTCVIANGTGSIANANVTNINVTCAANTYSLSGLLTGLVAGNSVTLQNNGMDPVTFSSNGAVTVSASIATLAAYNITVATQPVGQTCSVANGVGVMGVTNISNVAVSCVLNSYVVGGTLFGLGSASVTLQNKNTNNLTLNANGSFAFTAAVTSGNAYDITVLNTPAGYSCAVGNGSGTVVGADITDVVVNCTLLPLPSPTTLSASYALKQLKFDWAASSGATFYRLMSTPDGTAAYTKVGNDLTGTTATVDVALHLTDWVNARYRIDACNINGCTPSIAIAAADGLTNSSGYFKASNTGVGDQAGVVALSGDGNTLAIGAPMEDSNAIGVDGDESNNASANAGAVYVYVRTNSGWTKQAYLKAPNTNLAGAAGRFGFSLALSRDGNTLAVGAPGESSCASGIDSTTGSTACPKRGAVYVYIRSSNGWEYRNYIKGTPPAPYGGGNIFGYSVALSADGNTLIAGAPGDLWAVAGIIQGSNPTIPTATDWGGELGAVYVFARSTGIWSQEAYIKPLFIAQTYAHNGSRGMRFGMALAVSGDGDSVAIGAPGESSASILQNAYDCAPGSLNNCSIRSGAVYLFRRARANTISPWSQQALIKPTGTAAELAFGGYATTEVGRPSTATLSGTLDYISSAHVLSLTTDGNMLAVGSLRVGDPPYRNVPATIARPASVDVFAFTAQMVWVQQATLPVDPPPFTIADEGSAVGVVLSADGNLLAAGKGHVFSRLGGSAWTPVSKLSAAVNDDDDFGWSMGMSDDGRTLAIGQPLNRSNATGIGGDQSNHSAIESGAVYLY
jgi:hypothetical protein